MGVIASIWVFISIASREKLVWESGPGLELGPGPRCLNPEVINGRIVIISDQLTISRDRDQEHTFHFYMVTTHKEMSWVQAAERAVERFYCNVRV